MKLTSTDLKDIMYKFNISNVEISHYIGYNSKYISALRSGKYPISDSFRDSLMGYLIQKKKIDAIQAARIVKLGGFYE